MSNDPQTVSMGGNSYFFLFLILLCGIATGQELPKRLVNANLASQIAGDESRILPQSSLLSLASNFHAFYRIANGFAGYYHGGYWMDNLVEIRPIEKLALNARLIFYNPAMSYGVVSTFLFHPLISVAWNDNLKDYGLVDLEVRGRALDLDRQTLGAGLTLQDKEMSGIIVDFIAAKDFRLRYLQDGTGGYSLAGDVHYLQVDYAQNLLGLYTFDHQVAGWAYYGIFSNHQLLPWLSYRAELANRNGAFAELAGITFDGEWRALKAAADLQVRAYQRRFADGVKGQVEHDYLSIVQEDKPFTDSMNIFAVGDDVVVPAVRIQIEYHPTYWVRLSTDHELASLQFRTGGVVNRYFYRHQLGLCPVKNNDGCAYLLYSNKVSAADYSHSYNDRVNKAAFNEVRFVGIETRFDF